MFINSFLLNYINLFFDSLYKFWYYKIRGGLSVRSYLIMILASLTMSLLLTPLVKKLAYRVGAVDHPNHRKVHSNVMPRLGGLAIYISFITSSFIFLELNSNLKGILLGSAIIITLGIVDDIIGARAKIKLVGQILATIPLLAYGLEINFASDLVLIKALGIILTIFWVVGLINAVNLIDGLDGLAAGVSLIGVLSLAMVSLTQGISLGVHLSLILAGAILGFLKYNFNPAEIFMGDTGSMFLGYTVASISLLAISNSTGSVIYLTPILALGVPIFDTNFAFSRRMLNGKHPFSPDKEHIHHRFINFGLDQRQTVLTIYLISLIFGLMSILLAKYNSFTSLFVIFAILIIVFLWLKEFGIIRLGNSLKTEPIEILGEIRYKLVELEKAFEDELELAGFHKEIGQLEELVAKVPSFVYGNTFNELAATKEEQAYTTLRSRVYWLIEIIDYIVDNYQHNKENLNYIFNNEKSNLLTINYNLKV
jgi:UDP-GlcNAc:undecaprenyl-phosphate GlcNAc-1-phosphate transferase